MKMFRKIAYLGLFSALSIVLSTLEGFIPLQAVIPLPGIKIGIANVITLLLLYRFSPWDALGVLTVRCAVCALLFGTPVSFAFSLTGGILAWCGMYFASHKPRLFSYCGVSIIGAALHNTGQTFAAAVLMQDAHIFAYLPVLLLVSLLSGTLVGLIFLPIHTKLPKTP